MIFFFFGSLHLYRNLIVIGNVHCLLQFAPGGGRHSNNSAVHMHDQRNTKKGLFFGGITFRGQNLPFFENKGPFWFN